MKFETAFQRAFGRPPTRAEVEEVERICDAFDVRDNDALKHIVALLGYYHAHLRLYPSQCVTGVQSWLGASDGGVAMISSAIRMAQMVPEAPSPALPPASIDVATIERHQLIWVTLSGFGLTFLMLFGSVCMALGARLTGGYPCWAARGLQQSIAANLLLAPFGWLVMLAALVPGGYAASWGWHRGRDHRKPVRERMSGWATLGGVTLAFAGWLAFFGTLPG